MALAIGIDIGGTRLRAARVANGVIEDRASAPSSPDARQVLARVLDLVAQVRSPDVTALGIGVPGQVHAATRRVLSQANWLKATTCAVPSAFNAACWSAKSRPGSTP